MRLVFHGRHAGRMFFRCFLAQFHLNANEWLSRFIRETFSLIERIQRQLEIFGQNAKIFVRTAFLLQRFDHFLHWNLGLPENLFAGPQRQIDRMKCFEERTKQLNGRPNPNGRSFRPKFRPSQIAKRIRFDLDAKKDITKRISVLSVQIGVRRNDLNGEEAKRKQKDLLSPLRDEDSSLNAR